MKTVIKYVIFDLIRNRLIIYYTLLLLVFGILLLGMDENISKGILSLLNVTLLFVPIISILFTTIYLYNSIEFIELLLALPLRRRSIISGLILSIAGSLVCAYIVGIGLPLFIYAGGILSVSLLLIGILLTMIFANFAALVFVLIKDKTKGIGVSIILALFFTLLYDGIIMSVIYSFSDYPVEKPVVALIALNPVDLARVFMLLHLDSSVLLGYSGALFKKLLGSATGSVFSLGFLCFWILFPFLTSIRVFRKKDL
jgi:Cu-processing system permease protein